MALRDLLEKVLRGQKGLEGVVVEEVEEAACTKPGDNFMSDVTTIMVKGRLPGGELYSNSVFAKRPLGHAALRQQFSVDDAFNNEAIVYLRLLPLYDVTVGTPHCLHADSDIILLQDLRTLGYNMTDRTKGFDLRTATFILQALAKFHAVSYSAAITKKEDFEAVTKLLKPIGIILSRNKDTAETSLKRAIDQVAGVEDLEGVLPFLRGLEGRLTKTLLNLRKTDKVAVLCHGDFWINNILLREDCEDPVRLIDLQACAVLSPAVDIWTFLYTSLLPGVIDEQCNNLLNVYCKFFVEVLITLKLPQEHIPSQQDLLQEILSRELYGFIIGTIYLPVLFLDPGNVPNMESIASEQALDYRFMDQFLAEGFRDKICWLVRICKSRGLFG